MQKWEKLAYNYSTLERAEIVGIRSIYGVWKNDVHNPGLLLSGNIRQQLSLAAKETDFAGVSSDHQKKLEKIGEEYHLRIPLVIDAKKYIWLTSCIVISSKKTNTSKSYTVVFQGIQGPHKNIVNISRYEQLQQELEYQNLARANTTIYFPDITSSMYSSFFDTEKQTRVTAPIKTLHDITHSIRKAIELVSTVHTTDTQSLKISEMIGNSYGAALTFMMQKRHADILTTDHMSIVTEPPRLGLPKLAYYALYALSTNRKISQELKKIYTYNADEYVRTQQYTHPDDYTEHLQWMPSDDPLDEEHMTEYEIAMRNKLRRHHPISVIQQRSGISIEALNKEDNSLYKPKFPTILNVSRISPISISSYIHKNKHSPFYCIHYSSHSDHRISLNTTTEELNAIVQTINQYRSQSTVSL